MASKTTGGKWEGGLTPKRLMDNLLDEIDEERAKHLRIAFGQKRWLLSWSRADSGLWAARLSAPDHPETVEREGRTRLDAIERAEITLRQALELTA
jgi:hypothetical protein